MTFSSRQQRSYRRGLASMSLSGKTFHSASLRSSALVKLPLKLVMAVVFTAGASFVAAQPLKTICSFTNVLDASGLTLGNDGNFYGTTLYGGITNSANPQGMGTVFQVTTNGTLTTLASFNSTDGAHPNGVMLGNDGNWYGTTTYGGFTNSTYFPQGMGTVFQVTTNGTLTTLASFNFTNGANPSGLTLGRDGNLYGTTSGGGITNYQQAMGTVFQPGMGTLFQVGTNGTLTTLASFNFTNGAIPSGLTLANDGNFYGTTTYGGIVNSTNFPLGMGTVFQVTTNGTLTTWAFFSSSDGAYPNGVTPGKGGDFYGTTSGGGITNYQGTAISGGMGTVFQVETNGMLNTFTFFDFTNGAVPSGLTLGNDGNFYGTTGIGGITNSAVPQGMGTVFQVTTNGTLTTLASFNFTNGAFPNGVTLGNDGNWYGTTSGGGITNSANPQGLGTVFRVVLALVISDQPQSQTVYAGGTATFHCATLVQPVDFQWQRNGTNLADGGNISGATNSTLILSRVSDSDAGNYSAMVSNGEGTASSSNATLTVDDSDFFATQPVSQTVGAGGMATFTATVYGGQPFVSQWSFNGTPLGSPTSDTNFTSYTVIHARTNQAGNYSVRVINELGSLTSSNAVLTVIPQPTLDLQVLAGYPVLNLSGTLSNNFLVQYNATLADTNWINLLWVTNLSTSPYLFLDPSGAGQPARFYRAFFTQ